MEDHTTITNVKFGGCLFGGYCVDAIIKVEKEEIRNATLEEKNEYKQYFEIHPLSDNKKKSNRFLTVRTSTICAQSWVFPKTESIEDNSISPIVEIILELITDPVTSDTDLSMEVQNKAGNDGLFCNCLCCCQRAGGIMTLKLPVSSILFYKLSRILKLNYGSKHKPNRSPLPTYAALIPPCCYSHALIRCIDVFMKFGQILVGLFAIITLVNNIEVLKIWILRQWNDFITLPFVTANILYLQDWWVGVMYPFSVLMSQIKMLFSPLIQMCSPCGRFFNNCFQPMFSCFSRCMGPCCNSMKQCMGPICNSMKQCIGPCCNSMKQCIGPCCRSTKHYCCSQSVKFNKIDVGGRLNKTVHSICSCANTCQRCCAHYYSKLFCCCFDDDTDENNVDLVLKEEKVIIKRVNREKKKEK